MAQISIRKPFKIYNLNFFFIFYLICWACSWSSRTPLSIFKSSCEIVYIHFKRLVTKQIDKNFIFFIIYSLKIYIHSCIICNKMNAVNKTSYLLIYVWHCALINVHTWTLLVKNVTAKFKVFTFIISISYYDFFYPYGQSFLSDNGSSFFSKNNCAYLSKRIQKEMLLRLIKKQTGKCFCKYNI